MIHGAMDEYSDLDLVIVYDNAYRNEIMEQGIQLAEELEQLLSAFTGEHVGEPRLVICLYGPPLLHVDLKFISKSELRIRTENPIVLWERDEERGDQNDPCRDTPCLSIALYAMDGGSVPGLGALRCGEIRKRRVV